MHRAKPFIARALGAAEKAGGLQADPGVTAAALPLGVAERVSIAAAGLMTNRTRSVAVKARVVRHRARGAPVGTHVAYLRREGVTKDGAPGRMFDAEHDDANHRAFAERCEGVVGNNVKVHRIVDATDPGYAVMRARLTGKSRGRSCTASLACFSEASRSRTGRSSNRISTATT